MKLISSLSDLKDTLCPSCHKKGKIVGRETPESLLNADQKGNVTQDHYMFCQTPDCNVAYYSEQPDHKFLQEHLTVPVTVKDSGLGVPVCYCFHITRQKILSDIQANGVTNSFEEISRKIKEGLCACETMNPQGTCCLGNVSKWIKEAKSMATAPPAVAKRAGQKG